MSTLAKVVVVGSGPDYDAEMENTARCAIGTLGVEAAERWSCSDCRTIGCVVYVESYDERGHGSTFALCGDCCSTRLGWRR